MNKINKILFVCICLVLAICQINIKTYAISIPADVQKELEFKFGTPSKYDIQIDSADFGNSIKLPGIRVSMEDVLYSKDPMLSINFLIKDNNLTKDLMVDDPNTQISDFQKFWNFYRDCVRSLLHVFLYIAAATLITLLLYIALVIVRNGFFSGNEIPTPGELFKAPIRWNFGKKLFNTFNPKDAQKEKEFIEEWIKATFLIALIVLIINLISGFTNVLSDKIKDFKVEEKTIIVYVKGSNNNGNQISDFYFKAKLENYCEFMRQFKWGEFGLKNAIFMLTGGLIALLKLILYSCLVIRMMCSGAFIAIAPIIVLINSFKKIAGEEKPTLLKNWIKFYLFLAMFRPVIALVYYIFFQLNTYSFAKNFLYIILLYILYGFAIYGYIRLAFWVNVNEIGKKVGK